MPRIIAHLDMDAFFAAAEERENPRIKGLPIVVGADPKGGKGRGVVSTANYQAREYGIHSALPISRAWQLSEMARKGGRPEAVFLPVNFSLYRAISQKVKKIIEIYSPVVEAASIDEYYFDLSNSRSFEKAELIAKKIKNRMKKQEKLTASIGIGENKLVAKIASDYQKPDGLIIVRNGEEFLAPLQIRKIPGIGPKTEIFLKSRGINYIKDLKRFAMNDLENMLGKWGKDLYYKIRGIDDSPVGEDREIKSVGEQETFEQNILDSHFLFERLEKMSQSIFESLKKGGFKSFKTVVLTVRFADFETKSRSHTWASPINSQNTLKMEGIKLLLPFLDSRENPYRKTIRLIGLRVEKLS